MKNILLQISDAVHAKIKMEAARLQIPMGALIVKILTEWASSNGQN